MRDFDIMTEVDPTIGLRIGMAPRRNVMTCWAQEGAQFYFPLECPHLIHSGSFATQLQNAESVDYKRQALKRDFLIASLI
jgi:hypothetical protein